MQLARVLEGNNRLYETPDPFSSLLPAEKLFCQEASGGGGKKTGRIYVRSFVSRMVFGLDPISEQKVMSDQLCAALKLFQPRLAWPGLAGRFGGKVILCSGHREELEAGKQADAP